MWFLPEASTSLTQQVKLFVYWSWIRGRFKRCLLTPIKRWGCSAFKAVKRKDFSSSSGEDSGTTTSHAQVLHSPLFHLDPSQLLLMRCSVLPNKEPIEKPGAKLLLISNHSTVELIKAVFTLLDCFSAKHQIPDELPLLQQNLLALTSFAMRCLSEQKRSSSIFTIFPSHLHQKLFGHQAEAEAV